MNEYTRRLFGGKCPYTDIPCNNNDPCETCEVEEEERKEEERLDKAEQGVNE